MKAHWLIFIIVSILVMMLFGAGQVTAQRNSASVTPSLNEPLASVGYGFTYQGYLKDSNDRPITATCDFRFRLWDDLAAGSQVGSDSLAAGVSVTNGYFTAAVNAGSEFGASAFTGDVRWLEVGVKCSADPDYTVLSPRQALTAAPYALGLIPGAQVVGDVNGGAAIHGENTDTVSGNGVSGRSDATDGIGVLGNATATSGATSGVWGRSASTDGVGVKGRAVATSGENYGIYGQASSSAGMGVYGTAPLTGTMGVATSTSTYGVGVYGRSDASWGTGVSGWATDLNGFNYGVQGKSDSTDGIGVYGWATATSGPTFGVSGRSDSPDGVGVNGSADHGTGVNGQADDPNGYGVVGSNYANHGNAYGVYGMSTSKAGIGVYGTGNTGVEGETDGWLAVFGKNTSTDVTSAHIGVAGETYGSDVVSRNSVAVQGYATNLNGGIGVRGLTAGDGIAVLGEALGTFGTGIYGSAEITGTFGVATAIYDQNYGVYGLSYSQNHARGVYGIASATNGNTTGVFGRADSTEGHGTVGYATATSGYTDGVWGQSESTDGTGVYGIDDASSGSAFGVVGVSYSPDGTGVYGAAYGTTGKSYGVEGVSFATGGTGVYAMALATSGFSNGVLGGSNSTDGYGLFAIGNSGATGIKSAVVNTSDYGWRKLYSMESPDVLFEDVNTAQLVNGEAVVTIDPVFAETVNLNDPYQVFLSPHGDCGLYVAETTPTSFTVRALGGQTCSLAFDFRIVAKRLGYENVRLSPTDDPTSAIRSASSENNPASNVQP